MSTASKSPPFVLLARVMLGLLATAVASCSSAAGDDTFDDPDVPGHDANPEGVPYPTDHLGGSARKGSASSFVRGDRIPNFTFQAYVEGDRAAGLRTISLADYYDPARLHHRALHLEVAAVWCTICASYAEATVKVKEPLGAEGMVYLEVLVAGPASSATGPSLGDVDGWMQRHGSNFTTAIDVHARRLATIGVPAQTMPWDIVIDTRSMEILDSTGGAPIDLVTYDRSYLALVDKGPAAY
ncbi:MAG: hypothetical protein JWP97_5509 [Labilithrix sp.]|nr:hypothetical protein [Labilithrix sp.]